MSEEVGYDVSLTEEQNYVRFLKHVKSLISANPAPDKLALAVEALERMREGWANALELDIILPQHRTAATVLRDEAARALAAIKAAD